MANFAAKWFRYLGASANSKLEEKADPKIQLEQAMEASQRRHAQLSQQAAVIVGQQHQIEMQLARAAEQAAKLQGSARQALVLADQARAAGDVDKAAGYDQSAQTFATQLITVESSLEELKGRHAQAVTAAAEAKRAVEANQLALRQQFAERSKLLSQLEQAKMQEQMNSAMQSVASISAPSNVPTVDAVRDKIEKRYATALGASEITSASPEARMLEVEKASVDAAARSRLEEIRAGLGTGAPGLSAGTPPSAAISAGPAAGSLTGIPELDDVAVPGEPSGPPPA